MSDLSNALEKIYGNHLFVGVTSGDFTGNKPVSLRIASAGLKMELALPPEVKKLQELCGKFTSYFAHDKLFIGWNIKELYSYVLAKTGKPFEIGGKVFDLKILEWYLGINLPIPESFADAKVRLAKVIEHPSWVHLKNIYGTIYNPLVESVIPRIETLGIVDTQQKKRLYSHYHIDGQVNGRMKCTKNPVNGFMPHSMGSDDKEVLRPPCLEDDFISLDYKHMEVSTLQWLSGDPVLGQLLDSGNDLYEEIWTLLTTLPCNEAYRLKCKSIFLPVVYGQGVKAVAARGEMSESTAKKFVDKIYSKFPVAMSWIQNQQNNLVDGMATDVFGRCRTFEEPYLVRNFCVQSPAAIVCLEKLVQLDHAFKLDKILNTKARVGFHIHDGYILFASRFEKRRVIDLAKSVLEAESLLCPGLKLKVSCQTGINLNRLI